MKQKKETIKEYFKRLTQLSKERIEEFRKRADYEEREPDYKPYKKQRPLFVRGFR